MISLFVFPFNVDFREKGQRQRSIDVRNIDWLPSIHTLTGDLTCNLGMYADWKLNW